MRAGVAFNATTLEAEPGSILAQLTLDRILTFPTKSHGITNRCVFRTAAIRDTRRTVDASATFTRKATTFVVCKARATAEGVAKNATDWCVYTSTALVPIGAARYAASLVTGRPLLVASTLAICRLSARSTNVGREIACWICRIEVAAQIRFRVASHTEIISESVTVKIGTGAFVVAEVRADVGVLALAGRAVAVASTATTCQTTFIAHRPRWRTVFSQARHAANAAKFRRTNQTIRTLASFALTTGKGVAIAEWSVP